MNAIVFKDGSFLWITADEKTLLNHALLNGEKFVQVGRVDKTWNTDLIAYLGIPKFIITSGFSVFKFTKVSAVADDFGSYWNYSGLDGWLPTDLVTFNNAFTFDEVIELERINQN